MSGIDVGALIWAAVDIDGRRQHVAVTGLASVVGFQGAAGPGPPVSAARESLLFRVS